MADAAVEQRPGVRYFCHRCSIEFEDVLQDFTCPYCAGGFIEQLDNSQVHLLSGENYNDADMSNIEDVSLDDSDETDAHWTPPFLNDLAFLMAGGSLRNGDYGGGASPQPAEGGAPRRHTLIDDLVLMIGGTRPGTGAVTAGTPFVFVGAPGDYVFGGEGLDAVVTQLLGQLENAGPPPMPRDRLAALVDEPVTEEQAAAKTACSVCWDNFLLGETVCRLECEHIFHSGCIRPWLQLHATCPICRRSLLPDPPAAPAPGSAASATTTTTTTNTNTTNTGDSPAAAIRTSIAAAIPRILLRRIVHQPGYRAGGENPSSSSTSRTSVGSTPSAWTPSNETSTNANSNSSTSATSIISDIERNYNVDLDMD